MWEKNNGDNSAESEAGRRRVNDIEFATSLEGSRVALVEVYGSATLWSPLCDTGTRTM
jgi:hypothetical protein